MKNLKFKLKDIKTLGNYSEMGIEKYKHEIPRNFYGRLNIIDNIENKKR